MSASPPPRRSPAPARAVRRVLVVVLLVAPERAAAHGGLPDGLPWSSAWSGDLTVLLALAAVVALYVRGGPRGRRRVAAFALGLGALALALLSPVDRRAEALVSAHMVQHLLIVVVAAPLLALGAPVAPLVAGMPRRARRAAAPVVRAARRVAGRPALAGGLHAGTLLVWHLPGPYGAAVRHEWLHALEHVVLLAAAVLFWWSLALAWRRGSRACASAVLASASALVVGVALGLVMTFAAAPLYATAGRGPGAWGLSPLTDQQIGGAIMWGPGGLAYVLAASLLLGRCLTLLASERADGAAGPPQRPSALVGAGGSPAAPGPGHAGPPGAGTRTGGAAGADRRDDRPRARDPS